MKNSLPPILFLFSTWMMVGGVVACGRVISSSDPSPDRSEAASEGGPRGLPGVCCPYHLPTDFRLQRGGYSKTGTCPDPDNDIFCTNGWTIAQDFYGCPVAVRNDVPCSMDAGVGTDPPDALYDSPYEPDGAAPFNVDVPVDPANDRARP